MLIDPIAARTDAAERSREDHERELARLQKEERLNPDAIVEYMEPQSLHVGRGLGQAMLAAGWARPWPGWAPGSGCALKPLHPEDCTALDPRMA